MPSGRQTFDKSGFFVLNVNELATGVEGLDVEARDGFCRDEPEAWDGAGNAPGEDLVGC